MSTHFHYAISPPNLTSLEHKIAFLTHRHNLYDIKNIGRLIIITNVRTQSGGTAQMKQVGIPSCGYSRNSIHRPEGVYVQ